MNNKFLSFVAFLCLSFGIPIVGMLKGVHSNDIINKQCQESMQETCRRFAPTITLPKEIEITNQERLLNSHHALAYFQFPSPNTGKGMLIFDKNLIEYTDITDDHKSILASYGCFRAIARDKNINAAIGSELYTIRKLEQKIFWQKAIGQTAGLVSGLSGMCCLSSAYMCLEAVDMVSTMSLQPLSQNDKNTLAKYGFISVVAGAVAGVTGYISSQCNKKAIANQSDVERQVLRVARSVVEQVLNKNRSENKAKKTVSSATIISAAATVMQEKSPYSYYTKVLGHCAKFHHDCI